MTYRILKYSLVFFFLASTLNAVFAQSINPFVIGSGFSEYNGSEYLLSSTIGQVITPTIESNSNIVTQGFHQPDYKLFISVNEVNPFKLNVKAYPNPFQESFFIDLGSPFNENVQVIVFDITGKSLIGSFSQEGMSSSNFISVNTQNLPSGSQVADLKLTKI